MPPNPFSLTGRRAVGAPTNVAFAGPELELLVVANLGRWHLTALEPGLRGAPLHRPAWWGFDARGPAPGPDAAGLRPRAGRART
jgi:hypothetical protein